MESRGSGLFLILVLLTVVAGAVLVTGHRAAAHSEEFQRLVGGVGFGPALDLSGCAFGLDPRLDRECQEECGPVPGGACFCPRHAGSVFSYPPLKGGAPLPAEAGDETRP
jgi:hypothetical protein